VIILEDSQGGNEVKLKKATKRLSRIEALLSNVLTGYATDMAEVREPLQAAMTAVKRARLAIDSNQSSSQQESDSGRTTATQKRVSSGKRKADGSAAASRGKSTQPRKSINAKGVEGVAEGNKKRRANQGAMRNAPRTSAHRNPTGPAAKEVPANDVTGTQESVTASA
jgi:hypothetical protein